MDYKSFIQYVQQEIQNQYPDAEVIVNEVRKNNGKKLDSLVINENHDRIVPCIYLNPYYTKYQEGDSIDLIVNDILQKYQSAKGKNNLTDTDNYMLHNFSDFNAVKNRIIFKVINQEKNQELLKTVPYKKVLDLAIVYMILAKEEENEIGTILITNDHMKLWEEDVETLHSYAIRNTPELLPVKIEAMESVLRNLVEGLDIDAEIEDGQSDIYVVTNRKGIHGAATMFYPDVIKEFRNRECQNIDKIYILPSSIHKSLLLPCNGAIKSKYLQEMVCDINRTQVMEEEVLSDNVYLYDAVQDKIYFASDHEKGEIIQ